jgi:hypothetical protein
MAFWIFGVGVIPSISVFSCQGLPPETFLQAHLCLSFEFIAAGSSKVAASSIWRGVISLFVEPPVWAIWVSLMPIVIS